MWENVLSSYLDKILGDINDANVAQNIAYVLAFKVNQQQNEPFQLFSKFQ